jgi:hypothetical protein
MMEAASTSETSVNFYQTARCKNPEDRHLDKYQLNAATVNDDKPNRNTSLLIRCIKPYSIFELRRRRVEDEVGGGEKSRGS